MFGTLSFGKNVVDDSSLGMTRPETRKVERKKLVTEYLQTEYYSNLDTKRKEGSNIFFLVNFSTFSRLQPSSTHLRRQVAISQRSCLSGEYCQCWGWHCKYNSQWKNNFTYPHKHNNFPYFTRHVSTVHASSSVLHIFKSPMNSYRARCYKVRYIALVI